MANYSSTLAWKIPWTEEPCRLQSMGSWRVGHDWVTSLSLFTFMYWRRKWQPTPVFLPGESQGQRSLVGCHLWGRRVRHNWSDLAAAAERPTRCSRTNTKNRCPFHHRGLECRNRKRRDTQNNRWIWPGVQNEGGQGYQSFVKRTRGSQQTSFSNNTRDKDYRWTSPESILKSDWLYSLQPKMEKLYTVSWRLYTSTITWSWS